MTESAIDACQRDFIKLFKPFLQKLNGLRAKYRDTLGQDLYEATIADAARQVKDEVQK